MGTFQRTQTAGQELTGRDIQANNTVHAHVLQAHTMRQLDGDCVERSKQEVCRRTSEFIIRPPKASEKKRTIQA